MTDIIVNTYGAQIRCDNNAFVITTDDSSQRVPTDKIRSIHIGQSVSISSNAITLAVENEIDVFVDDGIGSPVCSVRSPKYGSVSTIRKGQARFAGIRDGAEWIKSVLVKKITSQQALLRELNRSMPEGSANYPKTIAIMEAMKKKVRNADGDSVKTIASVLRGSEGFASKLYFECMSGFLPTEYRFSERSQHPARDAFNAMLNYGYGVLYCCVESSLIKAGIDPYVGVLHRDTHNRPVLAYDVIELYRTWVDSVVCHLVIEGKTNKTFCQVSDDGEYWLTNAGRKAVIVKLNSHLDEIVSHGGKRMSRRGVINADAHALAKKFKRIEDKCNS